MTHNPKRLFALFLAMMMVVVLLPVSASASSDPIVVIAGSDYQNTNGGYFSSGKSTTAYAIMSQIKEDYDSAYGFLFGGDYYAHDTNTTTYSTNGKKQLKEEIVDVLYPDMADDTQIYIQGNHDADSLTTNGTLATSGAHDTDYYGVYVINEKDYMWYNNSASTIKSTASALESYLDGKLSSGYDKPIFVLSHLPLHYSNRTVKEGDGKYAKYIYDVLDEAGSNGLNIIFMYGHNHSTSYYEAYLGNGAVYLAEGSTIAIANEGSTSSYFTDTLNFTYMNYGFTGYLTGTAADGTLTMTVFEITGDQVAVKRYDTSGLHNLKSAGVATNMPSGLSADTTVIGTGGATIALTTPKQADTFSENGVTVTAVGLTGLSVSVAESPDYNTALYSSYEEYTIVPDGLEEGKTATIVFDVSADFDVTRSITVQLPNGTTKVISVENGSITVQTAQMGTFVLTQTKGTGVELPEETPDTEADGNIWRQVTSFTAGKKYILVNYGNNASGVSEYAINSSAAPTAVTVSSDSTGAYIENDNAAITWIAQANGSQFELINADTGKYLYASTYPSGTSGVNLSVTSNVTSGTNYSNWSMESNSNTDSALSVRRATSSNYYPVRYSNGGTEFLAYTSTQTSKYDNWVAIFEQTSEGSSSNTELPELGDDWVSMPSGGTYVLDTDGIDVGPNHRYIVVGNSNNYALTVSNGSVGQAAVTISGNTITVDDPSIYEFYFADNSSAESKTYLLTQDGTETVYHANGNMYYGTDSKGYWYVGSSSNGSYKVYDYDNMNWYLNYGYVWSSEAVSRFAVSSNTRYVRLYKSTSSVYDDTFLRLAGETAQSYTAADKATEATVLDKLYIEVTTDGYYLSDTLDVTADMLTWDAAFDGTTAGTYTATVTYEGQKLGTITVTVTAGHEFETITVDATCTEDGSVTTKCTICGEETVEVIKATGHNYECVETEASCGKDGSKVYTCANCADTYTEVVAATGNHSYVSETVEATCTEAGSVTNTCSVCGHATSEVIAALGHSYSSESTAPTCTEDGFTTYTCGTCGHSYVSDEVAALGHAYDSVITATCTEDGFVVYTCSVCGHSYNGEAVAAFGHSYESTVVAPTCATAGYTTHVCGTCGHTYTDSEVAALGHSYTEAVTAPTCTEDGFTVYTCTTCGHSYTGNEIAALGHDYNSVVTEPTFETEGFTTHTCKVCGDVTVDSYVPVLSHDYETVTIDATCTVDGSVTHTCITCGYTYTETLTAPGHSFETTTTEADCVNNGAIIRTCSVCGHVESETIPATGHNYETSRIEPTCTAAGYITYTCACGDVVTEELPATGHSYESVYTEPTCTESGGTTYTCTACGHSYTDAVAALGHSYEAVSVAPTCVSAGYTTYTCAACGDHYTADEIAALGHSYEEAVTSPTCTASGYTTYTCTVCGHSYTGAETAALGHNYSCVESDGHLVYTCDTCGDSYSEKIESVSYTKVTSLSSDNNYVITLYSGNKYYALSHEDNKLSVTQITVSGSEITSEITEDLVWTYADKKLSYEDGDTTYYLYAQPASGWWAWFGTPTLTVSTSSSSTVSFSSSKLKVGSYYLRYSNSSVSLNRSATTTYLFIEE